MQDILSFVQVTSPKTLAPSTPNTMNNQSSDGSFSESFFSIILGQFAEESVQTPLIELNQELPTTPNLELNTADQEAKSVDEHLLDDLLSVVNALQQNSQTTVFPTLNPSSTLEKILGSETARQDFANVKNVSDLMDLSKKYNLGLEKLSISQESLESLQTKFPKLTQNNFFDDLQTALNTAQSTQNSETPKAETTNIMSLLGKEPPKTETTPVSSILSTLINKPSEQNIPVDDTTPLNTPVVQEPVIVNEKQQNVLAQALQTPQEESVQATTIPVETTTQKVIVKNNEVKKATPTTPTTDVIPQEETVQIASTRTNDIKKEPLVKTEENDTPDTLLKPLKSEKTISDTEEVVPVQKIVKNEENETTQSSSEESQPITDVKNDIKTTKQDTTVKNTPVKESLNQFASDLKEKIETYKPPIMKVELSLSPKNLGEVDVTLLTRGNNLHVNISSNTSTMSLFTQNQNDVKNALINMGFSNLEMNFSDQNNKEQPQQNNQKQNNGNFEEFNEEETALLEIVIPQYV
ncbi:flagellar hook-length control protein FliK [Sulfurospirillum arsenophilum]|uniref:flagellar hook-length control protein FliK n=1 Tax=Sulfurospirillum arsenophilum TaxID=56698 RepID=UPI0005AA9EE2|nr:flagellar hook-length control protein FliK [Sulfurospirillum arsenophilum]